MSGHWLRRRLLSSDARRRLAGLLGLVLVAISLPAAAQDYVGKAERAILVDIDSGGTLYRKDDDVPFEPAAMAKMMTMAVVFDALKAGEITLDQTFLVSEHAWRTGGAPAGGATMFAKLNSSISVADLLRGAIVQAGNDACIILAEGLAGSEPAFVRKMNDKASELRLTGSVFTNVTGLSDPAQKVTARDLATIADYLVRTHPDLYKIYAEPDFTWNKIFQRNRNPLLASGLGVDGLSTGFTETAGFGMTASAVRDGHRMILVISGLATEKDRAEEARRLFDWGNAAFERVRFFAAGESIGDARVFGGAERSVPLAADVALDVLMQRGSKDKLRARLIYSGPLIAPVPAHSEVGVVRVWLGDNLAVERPVFTMRAIGTGSTLQRAADAVREMLVGWL